ncbi:DUF6207 family protein [Streptomyces sp. NPDC085665]|uniref:DUF6207 family protein n=1 Tax=Streptomyces sp. NPDC085665 TaxID=3365735 RepID=UPI0037D80DC6
MESFEQTRPRMIRIQITADDTTTAQEAAQRIGKLWLSNTLRPRRTPGEDGVRIELHADLDRRPEDGGYLDVGGPAE